MTHLSDHARAARILSEAFAAQASECADYPTIMILRQTERAYRRAAQAMEDEARNAALDHRCTLDHAKLSAPKCPACGQPRTSPN